MYEMNCLIESTIFVSESVECRNLVENCEDTMTGSIGKRVEHDRDPIPKMRMLRPVAKSNELRGESSRLTKVIQ
jgi:hypothetical protein